MRTLLAALLCATTGALAGDIGSEQAARLYHRTCSACHGDKGDGQSRARGSLATQPRDFTTADARRELPRDLMIAIVREGKHGTAMAGRKTRLSEEEIEGIVDFVRTAFMPPEPGTRLARGYAIYRQACVSCHGDRGQGSVIGHGRLAVPSLARSRPGGLPPREQMIAAASSEKHVSATARAGRLSAADVEAAVDYARSAFIDTGVERGGH